MIPGEADEIGWLCLEILLCASSTVLCHLKQACVCRDWLDIKLNPRLRLRLSLSVGGGMETNTKHLWALMLGLR
jgi:hypothetical protein